MKKILVYILVMFCSCYAQENLNIIIVSGEGIVESEPDLAIIRLGVTLQDSTADKVYQRTNSTINQIITSLQRSGIKKEDIKTDGIGLYPQYEYPDGKQKFIGYQMYHNLSVQVRKINKVANVIDQATFAGANTISNINFGFQEPEKLVSQARAKAIESASKKAQEIAQATNLTVGKIVKINESVNPYGGMELDYIKGGAESAVVAPGTNSVRVSVTITYEIQSK